LLYFFAVHRPSPLGPGPPSSRACRDGVLIPCLVELWKAARRAGVDVGRDQVATLDWLRWHNQQPLHGCRRRTAGEYKQRFYATH
jgi:hypothetical protein